jgi:general secretion pathway protein D
MARFKPFRRWRTTVLAGALAAAAALAVGCTNYRDYRAAQVAELNGDWDQAVLHYMDATARDPENLLYRANLLHAKAEASQMHFKKGKEAKAAGGPRPRAGRVPTGGRARHHQPVRRGRAPAHPQRPRSAGAQGSRRRADHRRHEEEGPRRAPAAAGALAALAAGAVAVLPKPVSLFDIYRALGKAFGINVQFDANLKDQQLAIELTDVTAQQALENLMRAAGHFYKVLDEHSILIAADTPQNRRTYEDLVIQTFFLSNAEVKDVMTELRSLVDVKKLAPNEQLNAVIVRDTADRVKVAESIIQSNDKSRSEVVVDIELLQISTDKMREVGMALSNYSVTQTLDMGAKDAVLHLSDIKYLNQSNWALTIPSFIYNFMKANGDGQLLAQPRLRISEGETGKLVIADKIPVPVTSFNSSQTVGRQHRADHLVPVSRRRHQDRDQAARAPQQGNHAQPEGRGQQPERRGRRRQRPEAADHRHPQHRVGDPLEGRRDQLPRRPDPHRGDRHQDRHRRPLRHPVLGNLFANNARNKKRTDLILTLTPHIIRTPDITAEDLMPISVGTEANITFRNSPRIESEAESPFEGEDESDRNARELLRQRMLSLPQGLQQGEGAQGEPEKPPQAAPPDLATGRGPSDLFTPPPPPPPPETPPAEEPPPNGVGPVSYNGDSEEQANAVALAANTGQAARTAAAVRIGMRSDPAFAGEEFVVVIEADAALPISHLPLALSFDPERIEVVRVESGAFLGTTEQSKLLSDFSHPGELLLGASRLGDLPGVAGKGEVARVVFRALKGGSTALSWTVVRALDPKLKDIGTVDARPLRVQVRRERPGRGEGDPRHDS